MSKITVNETVTKSVSFENNLVDVQTALDRCFQFLEEERFDEAHVIIEQVLNIEPNNTDAHVANFLYQFKLTCTEDVVKNFKECATYEDSVFYKRVKRGTQTELAKKFFLYFGQAHERLDQFNIEQERIRKEEEQRQKIFLEEAQRRAEEERIRREKEKERQNFNAAVCGFVFCLILETLFVCATVVQLWSEGGAGFGFWFTFVWLLAFSGLFLFQVVSNARDIYRAIKKKRQKQLDQQKTDQAAD